QERFDGGCPRGENRIGSKRSSSIKRCTSLELRADPARASDRHAWGLTSPGLRQSRSECHLNTLRDAFTSTRGVSGLSVCSIALQFSNAAVSARFPYLAD